MTTIGIDLGTSNSAVAYHDGQNLELIESSSGSLLMPSVVAVDDDGKISVGHQALRRMKRDYRPDYVFSRIKRQIGMPFIENEDYGSQIVNVDNQRWFRGPKEQAYSPVELSAEILKTLKTAAERRLGKKVKNAVITVPAGFNNTRMSATFDAGIEAGFKNPIIKTEPEMAALAFNLHKKKFSRFVVVDIGGGTTDVVFGTAAKGDINIEDKDGWDELGGADWDDAIWRYLVEAYREDEGSDLNSQPIAKIKVDPVIEEAKKELTDIEETVIGETNVFIDHDSKQTRDIRYALTREKFEELTAHLVQKTVEIAKRLLERNNKTVRDFDDVLLVGGMTRVPAVRKAMEDFFGAKRIRDNVNPDQAVARGAAIAAAQEDGTIDKRFVYNDVTGSAFGIEDIHGNFILAVPRGSPTGYYNELLVSTGEDNQATIPIAVLEGEPSSKARKCAVLKRYEHKVAPAPATKPTVELQFMVDGNGQLLVTGSDHDTGETFTVREA